MPTEIINPFSDIQSKPLEEESNVRYGSEFFRNVNELQVGIGSEVFRVDRQGIWLGAERFADAPFSVDMSGNITATGISLASLSGDLDDIADGSTYAKTTFVETLGASYAYSGLNSSGEIIKGFLNSQLGAKSLPTNGVRVDSNGIYGRKSGSTTFYIDSSGNAYFTGDIVSSTMTSSTVTGGTVRTSSGSTRVELNGANNDIRIYSSSVLRSRGYQQGFEFYNESGTLVGEIYASNSLGFLIAGDLSSGNSIYYGTGSAGEHSFHVGSIGSASTLRFFFDTNQMILGDANDLGYQLDVLGEMTIHGEGGITLPTVGRVGSGGTLIGGGTGWSATRNSTGVYTVTHNLGDSSYSVVATVEESSGIYDIKIGSRLSNSFQVRINDETDALINADFNFILIKY